MNKQGRSQLALGLILILAGAWFIASQTVPSLAEFADTFLKWPFTLVWIGALILVIGMLAGNPGAAIPAAIVAGIGGILYYNETYATQGAWAYMWALIPGFVGVGSVVAAILGDNPRQNFSHGINSLIFSVVAFLICAALFGGPNLLGQYGSAIALICVGVYFLGRSIWKSFPRKDDGNA